MLTVALIGISGYGRVHLDQLRLLEAQGRVKLVAATVVNPDEEAASCAALRAQGCLLYNDYKAMLEAHRGRLDLCCIPTAIHWHERMTVDALRAGAHVLVEKPLAGSLEEVESIRNAEQETGKRVTVGFQYVYARATHEIKRRILGGDIGSLIGAHGAGVWPRSTTYYSRNGWAGKLLIEGRPVLDSPVNNAMAHFLQWLLFMAGETAETAAIPLSIEAELYRAHPIESFDTANLNIHTVGGIPIRFAVSHASDTQTDVELVLRGSKGQFIWSSSGAGTFRWQDGEEETMALPLHREMQAALFSSVVDALSTGRGFLCRLEHAEPHTRCIVAAHQSAPIVPVPPPFSRTVQNPKGIFHSIDDIGTMVRKTVHENQSFHAMGIPWALARPAPVTIPGALSGSTSHLP